jgi:23S rRNA pseudouridine1911/1915/1917 synthase
MEVFYFSIISDWERLDKAVALLLNISRVKAQELISQGCVKLNNLQQLTKNSKLTKKDMLEVVIPAPVKSHLTARETFFTIVYEDSDLLVIDKPAGLTVHPGAGNSDDTLVNGLMAYCGDNLSAVGGVLRPGIVHRLDKDTSGLMVVAKNDLSHLSLSQQIAEKKATRMYQAIVWGVPQKTNASIETYIDRSKANRLQMQVAHAGKFAATTYKVTQVLAEGIASIVECTLQTGRTHQIRVHMSHIGHSVVGDQTYGHNLRKVSRIKNEVYKTALQEFKRQALHSLFLSFNHPRTGQQMDFKTCIAQDMQNLLNYLK